MLDINFYMKVDEILRRLDAKRYRTKSSYLMNLKKLEALNRQYIILKRLTVVICAVRCAREQL